MKRLTFFLVLLFVSIFIATAESQSLGKLYNNDGVTLLGNYLGCKTAPCDGTGIGWGYSNRTTGAVIVISAGNYAAICGAGPCKIKP